ncbi:MAG: cyclopropane-fatty-acyl-phospholipid synthase [Proteobacteria bacterium]|nr:cyclopropane-fatty-acyl-phospholipid synthase [Pseudomonadota bacterium]
MKTAIAIAESGYAPDYLTRKGIRLLLKDRLKKQTLTDVSEIVRQMSEGPLALHTDSANAQHYEVPARFFELMLGEQLKYSCSYYEKDGVDLAEAETAMLDKTMSRAGLNNDMDILELGCGWGSLTLAMARRLPESRITAVSNSNSQRAFIEARAKAEGLENVTVVTSDINDFTTTDQFDRVISIEMFEHLRNYHRLFELISFWLKPDGRLFFHIFCHKHSPYFFSNDSDGDWMARHFFTGGTMPSWDLPSMFDQHLVLEQRWEVNGNHYALTCRDWLRNLDENREEILRVLAEGENPEPASRQFYRWRMFTMACEELFAYDSGNEWFVGHYLMRPQV